MWAIFPSVISSFFTQNKEGGGGGAPLDSPLDLNILFRKAIVSILNDWMEEVLFFFNCFLPSVLEGHYSYLKKYPKPLYVPKTTNTKVGTL